MNARPIRDRPGTMFPYHLLNNRYSYHRLIYYLINIINGIVIVVRVYNI